MSSDWPILTKLRCKLLRGCYTQATCLATLRKVKGRSTFLATRNATIAVAKWGVTREFFLATCNATNVALQVARKIASCNMAFKLLNNINPKRTNGPDLIPCRILKEAATEVALFLQFLFTQSMESGRVPSWLVEGKYYTCI